MKKQKPTVPLDADTNDVWQTPGLKELEGLTEKLLKVPKSEVDEKLDAEKKARIKPNGNC